MISTLIYFDRDYYKYQGSEKEEQSLSIGGYESAFLADLVASKFFEKSKKNMNRTTYHDIYQDDGLVALKGNKTVQDINKWLAEFQKTV